MDLKTFEKKIGVVFKNEALLKQAFTHRSYINENRGSSLEHNERLEFLGDAVLELAATEFLYAKYPKATEGDLTSYRAAIVNAITLSEVASDLGFNDFLLLSKGEAKDTGRARQYILANTFESVLGAIYLDQGFEVSRKFLEKNLFGLTEGIVNSGSWIDAKSRFQELAQEKAGITPAYQTLSENGPDHDKEFTVGVFLGNEKIATGSGRSKQDAEQEAANMAISKKKWN
ncbi:MAG: ribonuclease III [Candidatus Paceibacterota bacterium]|jgi:ribonuclease-3